MVIKERIEMYLEGYFDAYPKHRKRLTSPEWERLYEYLHKTLKYQFKVEMSYKELQPFIEHWLDHK